MRRRSIVLLSSLLLLAAAMAPAQSGSDWLFRWDVRLWGGDLALGYRGVRLLPGVDTVLWVSGGGGYESANYFPTPDDAPPLPADAGYTNIAGDLRVGLAQGILYDPAQGRNLLEAILLYRLKYQYYPDASTIPASFPDSGGLLQSSILTGLVLDSSREDKRTLNKRGLYSALTVELVPRFLLNDLIGGSDYTRLSFLATGYLPLWPGRYVSLYLADRVLFDLLLGEEAGIPVSARSTFGALSKVPIGSNPFRGLGGTLRGVEGERYDGLVKMANNLDLRLHFPALTFFGLFTPMAVAFLDAGIYDRMSGSLSFDPVYFSTGAGVGLYALGFDFILYGRYFINEPRFSVDVGLGAHF